MQDLPAGAGTIHIPPIQTANPQRLRASFRVLAVRPLRRS